MFQSIIRTNDSPVGLILRLTLGLIMLPHGLQMVFGLFGGSGFSGSLAMFTGYMHIPWILALVGVLTPMIASIFLILGFLGRFMAFLVGVFLLVAVLFVHLHTGFFMNWTGTLHGEGFEYHLLGVGIVIALMITGSGAFSVDRVLRANALR